MKPVHSRIVRQTPQTMRRGSDYKARHKIALENHIEFLLKKNNAKVISKEKYDNIVSLLKTRVDRDEHVLTW